MSTILFLLLIMAQPVSVKTQTLRLEFLYENQLLLKALILKARMSPSVPFALSRVDKLPLVCNFVCPLFCIVVVVKK